MTTQDVKALLGQHKYTPGPNKTRCTYTAVRVRPDELQELKMFARQHGCDLAVLMRAGAKYLIDQVNRDKTSGEMG